MLVVCDAHEGGTVLSLGARTGNGNFVFGGFVNFFRINKSPFLNFEVSEFPRDRGILLHAVALNRDLSPVFFGEPDELLNSRKKRGESRGNDSAPSHFEDFLKGELNVAL